MCVKNAVEKRETSIVASNTIFQTAILQALTTRKTDLLNARSLTTKQEIKVAVKKSRDTFKSSKKSSELALKKQEKSAWEIFKTDIKSCKMDNIVNNMEKESDNVFKEAKKQISTPAAQNITNIKPPKSTPTPKPASTSYTLQDVQGHNTKSNCWTTINSKVYNLTSAFGQHPWWDTLLASLCGIEWTAKFNWQHWASSSAKAMLSKLQIWTLK